MRLQGARKLKQLKKAGRRQERRRTASRLKRKLLAGKGAVKCVYCGKSVTARRVTFDHVKPVSKGGYHKLKNGALACPSCNSRKGSMTVHEFMKLMAAGKPDGIQRRK